MPTNEFDVAVIGAGSAGSVVAAEASADGNLSVLLLEAGPDYPDPSDLPADLVDGNDFSAVDHDWHLRYRPSDEASGGQAYPRGKVIGGSSAVNTCIALRGDRADYEEWAEVAGEEWCWDACLPHFVALETDHDFGEAEYHGDSGLLSVRRYPRERWSPIQAALVDGSLERGYPACEDFNHPDPEMSTGTGGWPMNKEFAEAPSKASTRLSSSTVFLTSEVRARPNLVVRPQSTVRRVVVEDGEVRGIEIASGRHSEFVKCRNVVLSAGTIMTPAILVRSGIGPAGTLEGLSIPVVAAREGVGKLYEHPACIVIFKAKPGSVEPGEPIVQTALRYTSKLMASEGERGANDMQLEAVSFLPGAGDAVSGINAIVERSFSQGRVKVVSAEANAHPIIETEMLSDERDLERIVEGVRLIMEMSRGKAFEDAIDELFMPKEEEIFGSDSDAQAWARMRVFSGFHPAGTARMGLSADDPDAVCDQYGRVFGVGGLRVADASLMPTIIRSNLNVTSMMIGRRMGEWMREELGA